MQISETDLLLVIDEPVQMNDRRRDTTNAHRNVMPPGSTLRFRVKEPNGRFGSSWSIKTAPNSSDVYLSHREGARWIKTSFHESGQWHFSVTAAGQGLAPEVPAYFGVITDHSEIAPGLLHAMRITVARDELRPAWSEAVSSRDVTDIPTDRNFDAINLDIFLRNPGTPDALFEHAHVVGQLQTLDQGSVIVVARPMDFELPLRVALAPEIHEAISGARASGWDGTTTSRLIIIGHDQGEYLRQIEIALDPD